jgi:hypothetical protein
VTGDAAAQDLRAFKGHQHTAAGERVYECRGVADRENSRNRRRIFESETADRHGEPLAFADRRAERPASSRILKRDVLDYPIGATMHLYQLGFDEKAVISEPVFDVAEAAIATGE